MSKSLKTKLSSYAVDCICLFSIIGIWPRYIEPKRLKKTRLQIDLKGISRDLKIIHLTDLHFNEKTSPRFLEKIVAQVNGEKPDLILFTGDFLCYSKLDQKQRLKEFLNQFSPQLGAFCTFGNHDYSKYVSRNREGNYSHLTPAKPLTGLMRGLRTFFEKTKKGVVLDAVSQTPLHDELCALLKETPFKLLENNTCTLDIGLNLVGLGEYALGKCKPEIAFANYNPQFEGIVLSHNPDTFPLLMKYPGKMILSGHTHGEQIHFPFPKFLRNLSRKLTRLENLHITRGLYAFPNKMLYVNRGLGCHKPIRLFSPPEILVITANQKSE